VSSSPCVSVIVPSFNQGKFLAAALESIFAQDVPLEVLVLDGGSTDNSAEIIAGYAPRLAYWRSHKDDGQAAAINEGMARATAPFVCWLNSDDLLLPGGLKVLLAAIEADQAVPAVYGRVWNENLAGNRRAVWVQPFSQAALARRCIVSQPGSLIRRSAWEAVGGLDPNLHMAMDYDLWWRLFRHGGPLLFIDRFVAVNREHAETKTRTRRADHYREAMAVVRRHTGSLPLKWWLYQPYAVWWKTLRQRFGRSAP
jgi:GT2 family glycosyltransferase